MKKITYIIVLLLTFNFGFGQVITFDFGGKRCLVVHGNYFETSGYVYVVFFFENLRIS